MTHRITDINQVEGFCAASAENARTGTGCTVILCPQGAVGAVDVRGGAPATRETDLLRPEETVQVLHGVVLSGGSAYGLAASCGVAEELERRGVGLDVGVGLVPIVSSACVFDLACGEPSPRPDASMGARACARALEPGASLTSGNHGAGCGCSVGKFAGPTRSMKGGLGQGAASRGKLVVAAVSAVNACGSVIDPACGRVLAGTLDETGTTPLDARAALELALGADPLIRGNTTVSCVVTNARLTKAQATKVAQMAADAYAHAIVPTHTTNDGDTVFVMAHGDVEASVDSVGMLAVTALEEAIVDAVRAATAAYGLKAARDLAPA
ncbi:P1 family peptidase [Olsenella sp. HMSC062G07]|uniref:P1 family peptidase n=1 Tax=Olsenella sp. HMSC062G07 TaxID=1739330 RepID=UPI0008A44CDB|nr:P1 family peptidase [Olsenella sp. HMSC062G07]OFK24336.1 hypothetical protein HMPREF2826_07855 [Olsenella sp. HMSC062G07]